MDRSRGRRRLLALAIGCVAVAPVFAPARAATGTVMERGSEFVPRQIDVKAGDTVVWVYESGPNNDGHAVKFDDGPDLSPSCSRGLLGGLTGCQDRSNPTVQRTFTGAGTFPYYCKLHGGPGGQGMSGVVVVSPAGTTSSTAAATSSTLARATTTSSTAKGSASSTTATTKSLATSSTLASSSTTSTTADNSSVLLPGEAPSFSGDDAAAGQSGGPDDGGDSGTVVLIVGLLLAASVGGGYLLWRLRPGRA